MSLWQVPPYHLHPICTSIPALYPTPITPTVKARLVIVAGPALQPTPPLHLYPIFIPTLIFPTFKARPVIVAVPPEQYPPTPFAPLLPSPLTCFFPHPPSSYPSSGPACHCGRSRLVPLLTLLAPLPFNNLSFLRCGLPLWQALPPPFPLLTTSTPSITLTFYPFKPGLSLWQVSLDIPLLPLSSPYFPSSLSLSLFSCRPACAGPPWEIQSDLADALPR